MCPAAPIFYSQLDFYRFFKEPLSHQLRKFYAVDLSQLAQYLTFQFSWTLKSAPFDFIFFNKKNTFPVLSSFENLMAKMSQIVLQMRKICVNLCLSNQIYSIYLESLLNEQGINHPLSDSILEIIEVMILNAIVKIGV